MKIISFVGLKGGIGKTSLMIHLANAFSAQGRKVLVIDLDGSANASEYLLKDYDFDKVANANSYHWLTNKLTIKESIHKTSGAVATCDIMPSTLRVHRVGIELADKVTNIMRLGKTLKGINYDYVLIDTSPDMNYQFRLGLFVADIILTPIAVGKWLFQAIQLIQDEITELEAIDLTPKLYAVPFMATKVELERVRELDLLVTMTEQHISKAVAVRTANDEGIPLKENTKSWLEFESLSKEVERLIS